MSTPDVGIDQIRIGFIMLDGACGVDQTRHIAFVWFWGISPKTFSLFSWLVDLAVGRHKIHL